MSGRTFAPILAAAAAVSAALAQDPTRFHLDHVLGTSLDLSVAGDAAVAGRFRDAAIAEVERLDAILSGWREDTPVARLARGEAVVGAAPELLEVLELADTWRIRSSGAFDVRIGAVTALWQQASSKGTAPSAESLAAALQQMRGAGVELDREARTVRPIGVPHLALDGIAKGFILDRALAAARRRCPEVAGALLDIGGDAIAFGKAPGDRAWRVGVADPMHAAENDPLLAEVDLADRGIATSGGYARGFRVEGSLRSHILDPGTGQPTTTASATVIAPNAALADVLATTICVLGPKDGLELAARYDGVECLVIAADGRRVGSSGLQTLMAPAALKTSDAATSAAVAGAFPGGRSIDVTLVLPKPEGRRYERPYVAVWIEDGAGHHVRSLTLWGRERRWISELNKWWRAIDGDQHVVDSVSRATRGPGEYRVGWDGRDGLGLPVRRGDYTVVIEVAREHGGHTTSRAAITCGDADQEVAVAKTSELASATVRYRREQAAK